MSLPHSKIVIHVFSEIQKIYIWVKIYFCSHIYVTTKQEKWINTKNKIPCKIHVPPPQHTHQEGSNTVITLVQSKKFKMHVFEKELITHHTRICL